jgi:hypothetical protein
MFVSVTDSDASVLYATSTRVRAFLWGCQWRLSLTSVGHNGWGSSGHAARAYVSVMCKTLNQPTYKLRCAGSANDNRERQLSGLQRPTRRPAT